MPAGSRYQQLRGIRRGGKIVCKPTAKIQVHYGLDFCHHQPQGQQVPPRLSRPGTGGSGDLSIPQTSGQPDTIPNGNPAFNLQAASMLWCGSITKDEARGQTHFPSILLTCRSTFRAGCGAAQLVLLGVNSTCTPCITVLSRTCLPTCRENRPRDSVCNASVWPICPCSHML